MPTVSVVIPTYNGASTLSRSIDSVLSQTLEELELLIVDDGSTDHTEAVVGSYDDPRITYLAHETNRGASAARNTGLDHATGEYVAFLDSDDAFLPRKLERQIETLRGRSDDWVAAYCGVEMAFESDEEPHPLWQFAVDLCARQVASDGKEGGEELIGEVLSNDLLTSAGSTLLVRRDVAEAVDGFDESFARFQDPEFLIRVLERGRLACVDEALVRRYASGDPPADAVRAADEQYLDTFADSVARFEAQGYDITGAHHLILAKRYFGEGRFRIGLRYLRTARVPGVRQWPGLVRSVAVGLREKVRRRDGSSRPRRSSSS